MTDTTETRTATLLGVGPFTEGWFEKTSCLFELYPPLERSGHSLVHVVTEAVPEYDRWPAETFVFATTPDGQMDVDYYCEYGPVLKLVGEDHPVEAMHRLGYTRVIMDTAARV